MKAYTELFNLRGSAYDHAMQNYTGARDQEFMQAVAATELVAGMTVADVPAGGGYLARYLPDGCTWLGHEPCSSFTHHGATAGDAVDRPLLPLPWGDERVDVAISLAGVHHLEDKRPLFRELMRVIKPGGRLVISDVAADTSVARFLDSFVGSYNSTGHEGVYLGDSTLMELEETGWVIRSAVLTPFHWVFADRQAMADFCHGLFDIGKASVAETQQAIEQDLGVDELPGGQTGMRWALMTIVADKAAG